MTDLLGEFLIQTCGYISAVLCQPGQVNLIRNRGSPTFAHESSANQTAQSLDGRMCQPTGAGSSKFPSFKHRPPPTDYIAQRGHMLRESWLWTTHGIGTSIDTWILDMPLGRADIDRCTSNNEIDGAQVF